jgi:hypothetical protein
MQLTETQEQACCAQHQSSPPDLHRGLDWTKSLEARHGLHELSGFKNSTKKKLQSFQNQKKNFIQKKTNNTLANISKLTLL